MTVSVSRVNHRPAVTTAAVHTPLPSWVRSTRFTMFATSSAYPPIATESLHCIKWSEGPFSDSCAAKKLVRGGARSGRRAADQPHRTGQAHARTVRIGRQRFAEGGDGGRDDLCRLVTQPAVHGADLG